MNAGSGPTSSAFDDTLLARIEDVGINASAPREQRWVDGWLVRLSPAKAKRARCIQTVAAGRMSVEDKLALCLPLYATAALQPYLRITPFSRPEGLDATLEALGMVSIDDTNVMVLPLDDLVPTDRVTPALRVASVGPSDFAAWVGRERGSSAAERQAHADRIALSPVPHHGVLGFDTDGATVGAGQTVTFEFLANQPGTFRIYCNLKQDDRCKEMRGELVVRKR